MRYRSVHYQFFTSGERTEPRRMVSTKHVIVKCILKFLIIPSAPGLHRVSGLLNPDMTLYWLKGWSALPALFELRLQRI